MILSHPLKHQTGWFDGEIPKYTANRAVAKARNRCRGGASVVRLCRSTTVHKMWVLLVVLAAFPGCLAQLTCSGDTMVCLVDADTSFLERGPLFGGPPATERIDTSDSLFESYPQGYLVETYEQDATVCKDQLFLPLFAAENLWSVGFRATLYFLGLVWFFLGIALVSDRFMSSIEVITSKEKTITYTDKEGSTHEVTVLVWNETVANLTLMALGSSAPEIMLAVVETVGDLGGDPPVDGEGLGPSTIVGSAAFNLLVIIGICILAIPDGDVRRIKEFGVFCVTAFFSIAAYVWMLIVVSVNSEDEVTIEEAIITLLLFPVLVAASYAQDRGFFNCRNRCGRKAGALVQVSPSGSKPAPEMWVAGTGGMAAGGLDSHAGARHVAEIIKERGSDAVLETDLDLANYATRRFMERKHYSIARYVVNASRGIAGGKRVLPSHKPPAPQHPAREARVEVSSAGRTKWWSQESKEMEGGTGVASAGMAASGSSGSSGLPALSFASPSYDVFENEGHIQLKVVRTGNVEAAAVVRYETSNGTAIAGDDYVAAEGQISFAPRQTEAIISIEIIDDNEYEPDENFFVSLRLPFSPKPVAELGLFPVATVTIIDDDTPGEFEFEQANYNVSESAGHVEIHIVRKHGADGAIKLRYWTEDITEGTGDRSYVPVTGELVFEHGATRQSVRVPIVDRKQYDTQDVFNMAFEIDRYPDCGAKYGPLAQTTVNISGNEEFAKLTDKVASLINIKLSKLKVSTETWSEQFTSAMEVFGEEEEGEPAFMDYVMHFVTFFWKVLFAFIPPTSFQGGWLTFVVSLGFIGLLTAVVGDLASVFGCTLGLTEELTAITFVALGTSLPDTFASKTAAQNDEYADASVGNVTGSNSVNVFLGLGLPWTIATIYHEIEGTKFVVLSGGLGFSVTVFCIVACVGVLIILLRRRFAGGALGGSRRGKLISAGAMFSLWILYVVLAGLQSEDKI